MPANRKVSLKRHITLVMLAIAVMSMLALGVSAYLYQRFIFDIDRDASRDLIQTRVDELHTRLVEISTELGITLQSVPELRQAVKSKSYSEAVPYLNDHFHQYYVTSGVLSLQKIYLLDLRYNYVAQSTEGIQSGNLESPICQPIVQGAKQRQGADRLRPFAELCELDNRSFYAVIVPVGTLRPTAYLQIVVDPAYNTPKLSLDLRMPIKVHYTDGSIAFQSENWPRDIQSGNYLKIEFDVKNTHEQNIYHLTVAKDISPIKQAIQSTAMTVMFIALVLIGIGFFIAALTSRRSFSALLSLSESAEKISEDTFLHVLPSGYIELDNVVHSFNYMSDRVQNSKQELEKEVEHATHELSKALSTVEQRNKELETTLALAEQASTTKTAFMANMSHELRTPLNAVIGYSEMLKDDLADSGNSHLLEDIERIHNAGKHLLDIVNDILDLSKIEAGQMELSLSEFDLHDVLNYVSNAMKPLAEKQQNEIVLDVTGAPLSVYSDSNHLRHILTNITNNAVKFTSQGTITIRVSEDTYVERDVYYIDVIDTGIGIREEDMKKLFKPFQQVDVSTTRKFDGTGLGLALSKQLLNALGGGISLESTYGKGSTFRIRIPKTFQE